MIDAVEQRRAARGMDAWVVAATILLLMVGLAMVFSTAPTQARAIDALRHQLLGVGAGFAGMAVAYCVGWRRTVAMGPLLIGIAIVLLILVWVPHIGVHRNGAARWIGHGTTVVQPSAIALAATVVFVAGVMSRQRKQAEPTHILLMRALAAPALVLLLIEREPDLGTAVVLGLALLAVLFVARVPMRYLLGLVAVAGLCMLLAIATFGHRGSRLRVWRDPLQNATAEGYQMRHSLFAFGNGRLLGVGAGHDTEDQYLPENNTDFVYAGIAEQYGLVGSLGVLALILVLGGRAVLGSLRVGDLRGKLLGCGIGAMIVYQAGINIATVTNTIPATGVPLPLVSYGSTWMFVSLTEIGLLLDLLRDAAPTAQSS